MAMIDSSGSQDLADYKQAAEVLRDEVKRLRLVLSEIGSAADGYMEGAGEPEFSVYSWISGLCHETLETNKRSLAEKMADRDRRINQQHD